MEESTRPLDPAGTRVRGKTAHGGPGEFMDRRSGFTYMHEATPNYLYPRPEFEYFADNYQINTIVVHRSALTNGPYRDQYRVALTGLACDFENDQFLVYQLDQDRNALDAAETKDVIASQVA